MKKKPSTRAGSTKKNASKPKGRKADGFVTNDLPAEIQSIIQQKDNHLHNGISDAFGLSTFGIQSMGLPFGPANLGVELSQVNTFFRNLRFYNVSNFRQVLSQMYVEFGIIQTVVDVPVSDAFRGGVEIKTKQLDEDEVTHLQMVLDEKGDIETYSQAEKWNRLFGGAGVLTILKGSQTSELHIEDIQKDDKLAFRAVDLWELYGDRQNLDNGEGNLEDIHSEFYDYYGHKLHKSRVHVLKGIEAPSFVRPRLRGWGLSIIEALVRSVNQYLKANDLTFEVLDEFKVDYFKMKGLVTTLMSPSGEQQVRRRIQTANQQKNYQHAVVMDSEDDWQQRELSFSGLADTMAGIRMQIASDLRMPLTKVFGISAQGFNSGEDDIENYNAMVESTVRAKAKFGLINMIKLRCQQTFGYAPDDLTIEFKPLRVLGAEQEENVKNAKYVRLKQNVDSGYMTVKEFKDACNKHNLLGVQLDTSIDKLEPNLGAEGDAGEEDKTPEKKPAKSKLTAPKVKNAVLLYKDSIGITDDDLSDYWKLDTHEMNALHLQARVMNPGDVDEAKWSKAKELAEKNPKAKGDHKWALTSYIYKKMGGEFHRKSK